MKPTLLILAAGMGSRYGGLKQLDPMGPAGETVLDYSVYDAIRAGFGKIVFVIREDFAELFEQTVGNRFAHRIPVAYAFQRLDDIPPPYQIPEGRTKPWGTAHAVRAARAQLDGPFAVINADDFYGADSYLRMASWLGGSGGTAEISHYAMIGYPLRNTLSLQGGVNRGICRTTANGHLSGVEEILDIRREADGLIRGSRSDGTRIDLDEDAPSSMNFWGFPVSFLKELEQAFLDFLESEGTQTKSECYIPSVVDAQIRRNAADCRVLETSSHWFGVTYPEDKPHVVESIRRLIETGKYPPGLT